MKELSYLGTKITKLHRPVTISNTVKLSDDYYRVEFWLGNGRWGCQLFGKVDDDRCPNWREQIKQFTFGAKVPCWKMDLSDGPLYNLIPEAWGIEEDEQLLFYAAPSPYGFLKVYEADPKHRPEIDGLLFFDSAEECMQAWRSQGFSFLEE